MADDDSNDGLGVGQAGAGMLTGGAVAAGATALRARNLKPLTDEQAQNLQVAVDEAEKGKRTAVETAVKDYNATAKKPGGTVKTDAAPLDAAADAKVQEAFKKEEAAFKEGLAKAERKAAKPFDKIIEGAERRKDGIGKYAKAEGALEKLGVAFESMSTRGKVGIGAAAVAAAVTTAAVLHNRSSHSSHADRLNDTSNSPSEGRGA